MSKTYTTTEIRRPALPRSAKLRQFALSGFASVTTDAKQNYVGTDTATQADGHTHANLGALDQIGTDTDRYIYLTQDGEAETTTEKAKSGYADVAHDLTEDSPIRHQFLSRLADDTAEGKITFEEGLAALGRVDFGNYTAGASGAAIDTAGNAEVESLTARSYLKVYELIYNRINALEGDTQFSDSGTIESVSDLGGDVRMLYLRRRWEGDFTAFQPGDIIYGYVNDLNDSGTYHMCWGWVESVNNTANALRVHLYPETECPGNANGEFTPGMVIARRGNIIEPSEASHGQHGSFIVATSEGYVNRRQDSFLISSTGGHIVQLCGVNAPKISPRNYGTVLGKLPDGLLPTDVERRINPTHPYLYARGIVVEDLIHINYDGTIRRTANYRGQWQSGVIYRSEVDTYDTVTWGESLWQCVVSGTMTEPGTDGTWVQMAGTIGDGPVVWTISPSVNIIVRNADGDVYTPEYLQASVMRHSSVGDTTYTDTMTMLEAGAVLYVKIDNGPWREYSYPFKSALTTESGVPILAENGAGFFVGCDSVSTEGATRIDMQLRDLDDNVLAEVSIPVISDGAQGETGRPGVVLRGPMDYDDVAAGFNFQSGADGEEFLDVVRIGQGYYYCRKSHTKGEHGADDPRTHSGTWQSGMSWPLVATKILLAEYARIDNLGVGVVDTYDPLNPGPSVQISGGIMEVRGTAGQSAIRFGVNADGYPVLQYLDSEGNVLYDLGPRGLGEINVQEAFWSTLYLRPLNIAGCSSMNDYVERFSANLGYWYGGQSTQYYTYTAKRVNGIVTGTNVEKQVDGITLQAQTVTSAFIHDGWYCQGSTDPNYAGSPGIRWNNASMGSKPHLGQISDGAETMYITLYHFSGGIMVDSAVIYRAR